MKKAMGTIQKQLNRRRGTKGDSFEKDWMMCLLPPTFLGIGMKDFYNSSGARGEETEKEKLYVHKRAQTKP